MIRVLPQRGGWLEVVCGPMFSGKSEEMIRRLRRAEIAGQRVVLFKPRIDDRYDAADVVSHAGVRMSAIPVDGSAQLTGYTGSVLKYIQTGRVPNYALGIALGVIALALIGLAVGA